MTKQIILLAEPDKDDLMHLEDLLSVLRGIMRAFGYSDVIVVENVPDQEGDHDNE